MEKNYYQILGISRTASEKDIKKAFREIAKKSHPDKNPNDPKAAKRFREASEAYDVLSDCEKRASYDRKTSAFTGFPSYGVDNIFKDFESVFKSKGINPNFKKYSVPKEYNEVIGLTFEESITGVDKYINVKYKKFCSPCNGTGSSNRAGTKSCYSCNGSGKINRHQGGYVYLSVTCNVCSGQGQIPAQTCRACNGLGGEDVTENIKVSIPPGVKDGDCIRITKNSSSVIMLNVKVASSDKFKRVGNNIFTHLEINVAEAILGCKRNIELIKGNKMLNVPPGITHGTKLRMKGFGAKDVSGASNGDLLVEILIKIPKDLNQKQKNLVQQLKNTL